MCSTPLCVKTFQLLIDAAIIYIFYLSGKQFIYNFGRKAVLRLITFGFTLQKAVLTVPPVGDAVPPVGDAAPPVGDAAPPVGEAAPPVGEAAPTVGGDASFAF